MEVQIHGMWRSACYNPEVEEFWLSGMDSNHDKELQRLLCYHYTTGQLAPLKLALRRPSRKEKLPCSMSSHTSCFIERPSRRPHESPVIRVTPASFPFSDVRPNVSH